MYKIFGVGETAEYIVAETSEEALNNHWDRIGGDDFYGSKEEVPVVQISPEDTGRFEQEDGSYKDMTFGEFLSDFEYKGPQVICWQE
ncbi:hypothetical protein [Paenibacillus graminis]|uniref:hypothetical protein n=1 Tax=Paenibacillus graminis TaxID=189425 RepID=UPI002DBACA9B|nr:hypothetical protein [Paenibacillus graminis]MEC0167402.1 hypothetical protein [Paenibacillus graminis]